jgi:hypothetical protein
MESSGIYTLIVLSLSVITSYDIIAGVSNDEDRIWVIVGNRSVDGGLFHETLDIHEGLLLYLLPLEFDIFLDESGEE